MIYLHIGKPRSGKSYDVIRSVVLPALEKGRRVLTNIEGLELVECREWIAARCGVDVDKLLIWLDDDSIKLHKWYSDVQNGDCFVFDECQLYWPGGSMKPTDPEAFAFMTRHGHYNTDIHLITQSEKNVDSHIRRLCGQTNLYRKLGFLGLSGSYQVQYYNGSEPLPACLISSAVKHYDPEIFKAYKSIIDGADVPQTKQANILTSKKFIVFYIIIIFGIVWTFRTCSRWKNDGFAGSKSAKTASSVAAAVAPSLANRPSAVSSGLPVITYSSSFRLDHGLIALRLSDGSLKLVSSPSLVGGLYFIDSVFYAPSLKRGSDD